MAAPLLFLIADLISPAWDDDTAAYVREVAENPGAQAWSGLLYVIGFALIVPAVIGIVHLIKGRGVTLAHIGGGLAILGLGAFPALAATSIVDAVAVETINQADYVALIDGFEDEAAAIVLLVIVLIPALLSLLLIAAAVWRSGLAPWWVAAALIVSAVLLAAGSSQVLNIVSDVLLLGAFGFLGLRMLRMADSEWEHPPERWDRVASGRRTSGDSGNAIPG
jgi:hypothetical protein